MARIKESSISELKDRIDTLSLVQNYVKLEQRGGKWWGCCPFHGEKTASFNLDAEKGVYYCFGCNKGGSIFNFIMEIEQLSFVEAVEFIAEKSGFSLQYEEGINEKKDDIKDSVLDIYEKIANLFHKILMTKDEGAKAKEYLKERGILEETIVKFGLGFAPKNRRWLYSFLQKKSYSSSFLAKTGLFSQKYPEIAFFSNRIMFPITDRYGKVIAFGGRILDGEGAKYLNSKDMEQYKKGKNLFAFSLALQEIRKQKSVILCEGYMDVLAYHQAGFSYAVAPLGTALTEEQARYLKNLCDVFYLSFDSDVAGMNATYKAILLLRKLGATVNVINIKNGKDPADILKNEGAHGLSLLLKSATIDVDYLLVMASKRFKLTTPDGRMRSVAFFFPYIDALPSSVHKEDVVRKIATSFSVQEISILSDYKKYLKGEKGNNLVTTSQTTQSSLKKSGELRLLLAVIHKRSLFVELRSKVRAEDFENSVARMLYIALEECFREGRETLDELLEKIENSELRDMIIRSIDSNEFADNAKNILLDGIRLISLSRLKKRREIIVNKVRGCTIKQTGERELRELLIEKAELDAQISSCSNMSQNNGEDIFADVANNEM